MKSKWMDGISRIIDAVSAEPVTKYIFIITFIISILLSTQALVDGSIKDGRFLSLADKQLAMNFVEWFGVLYGFLLPTILVRVWEQFDAIDNVLDREADAIESLIGDLLLLDSNHTAFRRKVLDSLLSYCQNVLDLVEGKIDTMREKEAGNEILKEIRGYYISIFRGKNGEVQEADILKNELLLQLNNITDSRGDRISLSTQRLFESLNLIAVTTSIVWLVPFYFLYFQNEQTGEALSLGVFGWLLVISVTFLVIIILSIIDDLDKPFDGFWRVNVDAWNELIEDINAAYRSKKRRPVRSVRQETPLQNQVVSISQETPSQMQTESVSQELPSKKLSSGNAGIRTKRKRSIGG